MEKYQGVGFLKNQPGTIAIQNPYVALSIWFVPFVTNFLSIVVEVVSIILFKSNLPLFSTVFPSNSCCFCPVGLSLL